MGIVHLGERASRPPLTRIASVSTGRNFSAEPARQISVLLAWLARIGQSGRSHRPIEDQLESSHW